MELQGSQELVEKGMEEGKELKLLEGANQGTGILVGILNSVVEVVNWEKGKLEGILKMAVME